MSVGVSYYTTFVFNCKQLMNFLTVDGRRSRDVYWTVLVKVIQLDTCCFSSDGC